MSVGYYVTMKSGNRTAWLLGPFAAHIQALDNVNAAREAVSGIDQWSHFYSFGTARVETEKALPQGKLNNLIRCNNS